jgi:hypothetical protein
MRAKMTRHKRSAALWFRSVRRHLGQLRVHVAVGVLLLAASILLSTAVARAN